MDMPYKLSFGEGTNISAPRNRQPEDGRGLVASTNPSSKIAEGGLHIEARFPLLLQMTLKRLTGSSSAAASSPMSVALLNSATGYADRALSVGRV
jgi:hypothetical protein